MPQYQAPIRDFTFILEDFLDVHSYREQLQGFDEVSDDLIGPLLQEGAKLCEEVLFPLNQSGDAQGCHFEDGSVRLPTGFKEAYQTYIQAGWTGFTCDKAYGGQGLPEVLNMPMIEMICSANLSFGMTPGLTHGAYNALYLHASDAIKQRYLPPMVSGQWSGVMCLTEPQCGTDLGLVRTKATPGEDGSYVLDGSKIFISAGEHDAAENIIHLVLARLPGAPEGSRGISLFVVPKIWVDEEGKLAGENGVTCGSIEEKMGIHASPTCVMHYNAARGFLVGEPNRGVKAMFTMMNEARLYVGVQGLGLSEIAYQNAALYAKERLQGRALKGAAYPDKPADPLLVHPDVRRQLLTMRSFNEGARMLTMYTALQLDIKHRSSDADEQQEADDFIQLVTPILKAHLTDMGFESCNMGMQIFGGHGYIREYGMEQYVRDARIAQIYEGANGVQALDLVGRKLSFETGRYLRSFFHPAVAFVNEHRGNDAMTPFCKPLHKILTSAQQASLWIAANGLGNPNEAAAASVEYLRLMAHALLGYMWARAAAVALQRIEEGSDDPFYQDKLEVARFYMERIVPQHYGQLAALTNGCSSVMALAEERF